METTGNGFTTMGAPTIQTVTPATKIDAKQQAEDDVMHRVQTYMADYQKRANVLQILQFAAVFISLFLGLRTLIIISRGKM